MIKTYFSILLTILSTSLFSQKGAFKTFISDSSMIHSSVSLCVIDSKTGEEYIQYNSEKSLTPASVMKLITSAAAIELLGPEYTFKTVVGYTGFFNKKSGKLSGDIVIKGGGDPALGSAYFSDHYKDFADRWVMEIKNLGIKKIDGRVITDDSYYDFQPVPPKWLWEDAGNYYGAGAYGLSAFDNTYQVHLKTTGTSGVIITGIVPEECKYELSNRLSAAGRTDEGYVFAAPYSKEGWIEGTVPENTEDFVLKASITDPPQLIAEIVNEKLIRSGVSVSHDPSTYRSEHITTQIEIVQVTETTSPPLSEIIEVLNHESVNLFAEHLIKELGKKYLGNGSTVSGIVVVKEFLKNAGISTDGSFIEDGSGLSPLDAITTRELVDLLSYMKNQGRYSQQYFSSLPEAGKEGTLKNYFKDPVFESRLIAKSGSMIRVRSYAGYFTTLSGKQMIFSIIVNNYTGPSKYIITGIEEIIKELILLN